MRKIFINFFFLFSFVSNAQDSLKLATKTYSFVKNEKIKDVVYRGIQNPISINVPEAKSFVASGLGLKKENDKYYLAPGQGLEAEIKLEITLQNDSIINESHFFEIKGIKNPIGLINGKNCYDCIIKLSKEEFLSGVITYKVPDFNMEINFYKVLSYDLIINKKELNINGNKIPDDLKIRKGHIIKVKNIEINNPSNICLPAIYPIEILIID
jgi:hypothetical protein